MLMTNLDLMFVLQQLYPQLEVGKDYVTGCKKPNEGFTQQEHAFIWGWRADVPQPTQEFLEAYWEANMSAMLSGQLAQATRVERNNRLDEADTLVEKAIDKGDAVAERAARDYRQALRDVPMQPGFPDTVNWPVKPS